MSSNKKTYPRFDDLAIERFSKDPEFLKECLKQSFDHYNKEGNVLLLLETLKQAAKAKGMTQLAKETGLSRQYLYKMVSKEGNPTISTLNLVLESFGFKMQIQLA